jgi:hypothetical protein
MRCGKREYRLFEGDRWCVHLEELLRGLADEINKQETLSARLWRLPEDLGNALVADIYLGKRSETRIGEAFAESGKIYSNDETFTLDRFLQNYKIDKYTGKKIIGGDEKSGWEK